MNIKSLLVGIFAIGLSFSNSYGQITENPRVEEQSEDYVKIKRVELTDQYTIIYLQFVDRSSRNQQQSPQQRPRFPFRFPDTQDNYSSSTISLQEETRLYKPGEIDQKFKLIKAENIPVNSMRKVVPGETVNFVAYFERLTPGIEVFDFYEGRSNRDYRMWNFYGVHVTNPLNKKPKKPVVKTPEPAVRKEEPAVVTEIPKPIKEAPAPVKEEEAFAMLGGTIFNAKTRQPISAVISYQEKGDSLQVRSGSGKYRIGLDRKEKYNLRVTSKGFFGSNIEVTAADSAGRNTLNHDVYLTPLAVGEAIALSKIYFATSEYNLLPESFTELNQIVETMKDNPELGISVEGHTDNVGDPEKNIELSKKRAEAVKGYLIKNGIDAKRIEAKGWGSTKLLTKSTNEEERRKNRRVELVITGV